MGVLSKIKDFFKRTEVTEETFEYESVGSLLARRGGKEQPEQGEDVAFKCDQIVDATYQMEDLRVEYDMVTSYFTDIQTIEELPGNVKNEITDIAKRIAFLENETSEFLHSEDRISDEDFRMIQGVEKNLSEVFGQMNELETMGEKIKRDMKNLEAEKNSQEYLQEVLENRQRTLKRFLVGFGSVAVLAVLTLTIIGMVTDTSLLIPVLLVLLLVVGMAAMSVVSYRNMSYEYKLSEKRENRAINLMNKVKIKYINNTATLDYLYEKYNVRSLRELEYLYDQYQLMLDEVRKFQKSSGDLRQFSDELSKILYSHGIKDPEIWIKQSKALIDSREMVEVKHSLNVRRQKLREQIAYNEELRLSGLQDIQAMLKANPDLREDVRRELEIYHIKMQ